MAKQPQNLFAKAVTLHEQGELAPARIAYARYIKKNPKDVAAHSNMGSVCRRLGDTKAALMYFEKALALDPHHADALNNLGNLHRDEGRQSQAVEAYTRSFDSARSLAQKGKAAYNLGHMLFLANQKQEAKPWLQKALDADPLDVDAALNLTAVLMEEGLTSKGISMMEDLLVATPYDARILYCLASLYRETCNPQRSFQLLTHAIRMEPDRTEARSSFLMGMQYTPEISGEGMLRHAQHWGVWAKERAEGYPPLSLPPAYLNAQRPLRVGYVSGDMFIHVVGWFFKDVLAAHDKNQIMPFLYTNGSPHDALFSCLYHTVTEKGGGMFDVEKMDDQTFAALIRQHEIDILVDLSGHTGRSRIHAFAFQCAPVQISWLGYFATTGLPNMDYSIMDPWHAPEGTEDQFTERLIRLPHNRFCYSPVPFAPEVAPPPFIKKGYVTFGSFNNTAKLNPQVVQAWAKILELTPESRLILKWRSLADPQLCAAVHGAFAEAGIDSARVELRPQSTHKALLEEYADVDIALDPFPFSGGHTSCEALWMGLPVVTWPQERVVSRQTYSFLMNVGLGGLAVESLEDYVRLAVRLANSPDLLQELRSSLRQRMRDCPLCDVQGFTRHLEEAYALAWQTKMGELSKINHINEEL